MIKLLNANFTRLRKNRLFWLLTIFSIGIALFMVYTQYSDLKRYGTALEVEQLMLNYSTIIGVVSAIFTSLFLGVEYSDGAIRNKISIGHKRINIYLSNLIVVVIVSLFSYIVFLGIVSAVGIPLLGKITITLSQLLMLLGCVFVTITAYSSIFTFMAMIISNKTITAIVCIMLSFGMMMVALTCLNILQTPEFNDYATIEETGGYKIEQVPNPKYPSDSKKKVCQTLLDINPAGQMFQIAGRSSANLKILPLYSLGILVIFTGAGLVLFRKKELK